MFAMKRRASLHGFLAWPGPREPAVKFEWPMADLQAGISVLPSLASAAGEQMARQDHAQLH